MSRKKTSVYLDEDLWAEFKSYCAKERKSMSEVLENLIQKK